MTMEKTTSSSYWNGGILDSQPIHVARQVMLDQKFMSAAWVIKVQWVQAGQTSKRDSTGCVVVGKHHLGLDSIQSQVI